MVETAREAIPLRRTMRLTLSGAHQTATREMIGSARDARGIRQTTVKSGDGVFMESGVLRSTSDVANSVFLFRRIPSVSIKPYADRKQSRRLSLDSIVMVDHVASQSAGLVRRLGTVVSDGVFGRFWSQSGPMSGSVMAWKVLGSNSMPLAMAKSYRAGRVQEL